MLLNNKKFLLGSFSLAKFGIVPPVALKGQINVDAGIMNDIPFTFDMTRGDLLREGSFVSFDFIRLESDDKNGLQIARVQLAS